MKTAPRVLVILAGVLGAALIAFLGFRIFAHSADAVHYVTRPVGYADITATVSETGTVNPVNEVSVGCEVSGTIKSLSVDYNSRVSQGQVLATIDPTTFQAAVNSALAGLKQSQASLHSAEVNVDKMKAEADLAEVTVRRDEELIKQGYIAKSQLDTDQAASVAATQDYLAAKAAVLVAEAQVSVAQAQLQQAQFNLSRTVITSPIDGIVLARNVSVGQTVAASFQTPTLFTLATNLTDMQVDTSVDEADVGSVRAGESALITVTAFPNVVFKGLVQQLRVDPTVTQNVVTYDAVVAVHDDTGRLLPGMTAQVTIDVGTHANVLSIPTAALLYRPYAFRNAGAAGGLAPGGFGFFGGGGSPSASASNVASAPGSPVTVWSLRAGRPVPVRVIIGLSDNQNVEITSGDLQPGEPVIVAQQRGNGEGGARRGAPAQEGRGEGMPPSGQSSGAAGQQGGRAGAPGGAGR